MEKRATVEGTEKYKRIVVKVPAFKVSTEIGKARTECCVVRNGSRAGERPQRELIDANVVS